MIRNTIELNGVKFACREQGRGAPLVLVHANLSDMRSWETLEPLLAEHFHVISYSRRFAWPNKAIEDGADDPLAAHADDLVALIKHMRLGRTHLVGNSAGAFIALLAAQKRPDLVRTLTLEEPPVVSMFLRKLPPNPIEVIQRLLTSPAGLVALLKFGAGAIGPATRAFRDGRQVEGLALFARGVLGEAAHAELSLERRQQMLDNLRPHRAALLGAGLPVFTPGDAAAIAVPTRLIRGSETPTFQRHINRRLAGFIPGAQDVCIPGASHLVHEDSPQAVAETVLTFCKARRD